MIRPSSTSSLNALPKALTLPRLPPGTTIQSGTCQARASRTRIHDRLLPFEPEGIDAVDQVDAELAGHLLHALHGVVEVAEDLHGQGAVVEGLGQLAVSDLARADEDDGPHQAGGGADTGPARRWCCRWKRRPPGRAPTMRAWVKAADMPLSLKLPDGLSPSYCRNRPPGFEADIARHGVGPLQQRLPFADGHDLVRVGEGQQIAKTPDAAEAERIMPLGPAAFEETCRLVGGVSRVQS